MDPYLKHDIERWIEDKQIRLVGRLPRWVKKWAFIEVTNEHWRKSGKEMGDISCVDALKDYAA